VTMTIASDARRVPVLGPRPSRLRDLASEKVREDIVNEARRDAVSVITRHRRVVQRGTTAVK
jgi:hypothetical protein